MTEATKFLGRPEIILRITYIAFGLCPGFAVTTVMKNLSNELLVLELKSLVSNEIKFTAQILEYLRKVDCRGIFLQMGYASLFEFCLKELKYSETSAIRRISAMRLLRELPEVQEKIVRGELTLSVVSQAHGFFKQQEKKNQSYSPSEKLDLLKSIENTSSRESERILLKIDPNHTTKDKERLLCSAHNKLKSDHW